MVRVLYLVRQIFQPSSYDPFRQTDTPDILLRRIPELPAGVPCPADGFDLALEVFFGVVDAQRDDGCGGLPGFGLIFLLDYRRCNPVFLVNDEFDGFVALVLLRVVAITDTNETVAVLGDQFLGAGFAGFADGADLHGAPSLELLFFWICAKHTLPVFGSQAGRQAAFRLLRHMSGKIQQKGRSLSGRPFNLRLESLAA